VQEVQDIPLLREMGPEPLALAPLEFLDLLERHRNKSIKGFFLDQRSIAGIGNVYGDEILFQAGIHPRRRIADLSPAARERLYQVMQQVLQEATELMAAGQPFPDSWLLPHRYEGLCPAQEGHGLIREIIAGRAAIYCPECQK